MSDPHEGPRSPQKPVQLDHRHPPEPQSFWPAYDRWRARIPTDPRLKRWWWRRGMYYLCLACLFAVVAFYLCPNVYLFGRPYRLGTADFIGETQDPYNIAAVRAIKRFRKEHGKLPKDYRDVVPAYIPANVWKGNILNGDFITYSYGGPAPMPQAIIYRFAPGVEGWWVEGSFAYGKIPVPPVSLEPKRSPSTQRAR